MAKSKTRERRQARTREAIIQAAEEIITEQGPEALNMRDLAERIDYSASNLYEYFKSKEKLLTAVANEALMRLATRLNAVSSEVGPLARLKAYGQAYLEFARTHPELYLLTFGRKFPDRLLTGNIEEASSYNLLLQLVRESIASGELAPRPGLDVHEIAFGCWSLVHGIAMLRLTMQGSPWEAVSEGDLQLIQCLADGLRAR
jgi:AcrR family transcriptional regulator